MIGETFSMNNILLVSQNKDIAGIVEKAITENSFSVNFRLEVCSDLTEVEKLLTHKDFFSILVDTSLYDDLSKDIHKLSFLVRYDIYVIAIGKAVPYEIVSRLIKCGLSDFVDVSDVSEYVKSLVEMASEIFGKNENSSAFFKKIFKPDSLDKLIFSSLVHEIRNNNNIASLNTEMVKGILKRSPDDVACAQKDEIIQYIERSMTGLNRTTEMVEVFSYINKLQQSSMGSASDFESSFENVKKCFAHNFKRIYTDVIEDISFKIPVLRINQRDVYRVLLSMFYLAGLSISDTSKVLKIAVFQEGDECGFSMAFLDAFLYKIYFDNEDGKYLLLPKEYICCLDVLKGFVSLYGGSFSLEENSDGYPKLKFCFSSKMFFT